MTPIDMETGYYWVLTDTTREPMIGFFYKDTHLPPWFFFGDDNSYDWKGITKIISRVDPPQNWK